MPSNITYDRENNQYREQLYQSILGVDTFSSLTAMVPGSLRIGNNINITQAGTTGVTRDGYTNSFDGNEWTNMYISQGTHYQITSSTEELLLFGHDGTASSGVLAKTDANITQISANVKTSLAINRPTILQFKNLIFLINGTDDFLYDGSGTRQIGITAPTGTPTVAAGSSGGAMVEGGSYIFAYSYYNSTTGAESSLSAVTEPFTATATGKADVSVNAGSSTTADKIRLYRTFANGSHLYLDTTADISATTVTSQQRDAGLDLQREGQFDNTRLATWGTFNHASVIGNRIFGILANNPNRVRFSAIGFDGPLPESFRAEKLVDCESGNGYQDLCIAVAPANEIPIVLKRNSVGRLDRLGSINTSDNDDTMQYEYHELAKSTTTAGKFAHTNVYRELVWLGTDNVYATDGNEVRAVGTQISDDIKNLVYTSPDLLSAVNDVDNKRIYFSVVPSGSSTPDWQLVGHYHDYPNFYWTFYKPGSNTSTHPGLSVNCFIPVRSSNKQQDIYFGNTDGSGDFYKMNSGTNDDGSAIAVTIRDYPTSFGFPEEIKTWDMVKIMIKGNGNDYKLTVRSVYDLATYGDNEQTIDLAQGTAEWDTAVWDVDEWTEEKVVTGRYSHHRKANFMQTEFEQLTVDSPITLYGYTKFAKRHTGAVK